MPYYILQKGNNIKNRYAIKAKCRDAAHKKIIPFFGVGAWSYINKSETAEGVAKFGAVIVGE